MKSISISAQGISRLNWVCKWQNGLSRALKPAIHILAGENVCIQQTRPIQASEVLAALQTARISSGVVTTGLKTTLTGISVEASRFSTIFLECSATWAKVWGPYKCWLPVMNQISSSFREFMVLPFSAKMDRGWEHIIIQPRYLYYPLVQKRYTSLSIT